jgi:hypothetical protein
MNTPLEVQNDGQAFLRVGEQRIQGKWFMRIVSFVLFALIVWNILVTVQMTYLSTKFKLITSNGTDTLPSLYKREPVVINSGQIPANATYFNNKSTDLGFNITFKRSKSSGAFLTENSLVAASGAKCCSNGACCRTECRGCCTMDPTAFNFLMNQCLKTNGCNEAPDWSDCFSNCSCEILNKSGWCC